jgi:hypothetical protein
MDGSSPSTVVWDDFTATPMAVPSDAFWVRDIQLATTTLVSSQLCGDRGREWWFE